MSKKWICWLLGILMMILLVGAACADDEVENETDDYRYRFIVQEDGTAILTYLNFKEGYQPEEFTFPDMVKDKDGNKYTVTGLENNYFLNVKILTIPDSITISSEEALQYLGLDVVEYRVSDSHPTMAVVDGVLFNKPEKALIRYPDKKEDVLYDVPEGISAIAPFAFRYARINKISLPDSLQQVGAGAFMNTKIKEVTISGQHPVFAVEQNVLYNKVDRVLVASFADISASYDVPEGITGIGPYAFAENKQLVFIKLPSSLRFIGDHAFDGSALQRIEISEGLEQIMGYTFYNCKKLESVQLPESLQEIGDYAFFGVEFETLNIPSDVKKIGIYAFSFNKLKEITLSEGVESIGADAFNSSHLKSIVLPASACELGQSLFGSCYQLKEATILGRIEKLPYGTFMFCESLEKVTLPDGIQTIGASAFFGCGALQEVVLPEGLKTIEGNAFYNCKKLKALTIPESTDSIDSNAFSGTEGLVLTVVKNSSAEGICLKNGWEYVYSDTAASSSGSFDWLQPEEEPYPAVCPECGYELPQDIEYKFCPMCATPLIKE